MAPQRERQAVIVADEINEQNISCVKNVIRLLDEDNSVPFIARYRRAQTGGMDAEKLRDLKRAYDNLKAVNAKAEKIVKSLGNTLSKVKQEQFFEARTLEEINELHAPFKKGGKGTLAERARQVGLEAPAMDLLNKPRKLISFNSFMRTDQEGLKTIKDVKTGIQHIIAEVVSKDQRTNDKIRRMVERNIFLESKTTEAKAEADKEKKFQNYYNFSACTDRLLSHQILAINRGEEKKILTVKLNIQKKTNNKIMEWLNQNWVPHNVPDENGAIFQLAVEDSYKRLLEKKILKRARVKLTRNAEREAVVVFSKNLKRMLLASPARVNMVAIDPGFHHGCKIVALDSHGHVLESSVIHPFGSVVKVAEKRLIEIVKKHRCEVIGIGNGTACRETESWLSELIKTNVFDPLDVKYCIVNESGASVYSVTKEAETELPNMDPNLRSAVSIGRRLQDPLLELVKIEPKHLGVGMYQHDVSEILMKGALEGVLEDCVSFVGVDLNASSAAMLKRIAGLGGKKADAIVAWREKNGPFINRKQLLLVKGLGQKAFEQCSGFLRVTKNSDDKEVSTESEEREATGRKRKAAGVARGSAKKRKTTAIEYQSEALDATCIHPESYEATYKMLKMIGASEDMIGTQEIFGVLESAKTARVKDFVEELKIDEETIFLIIKGLQQPLCYDIRSEMQRPSFKKYLKSLSDLKVGQKISGIVANVTSFGVFVDCGVGKNGLIHKSQLAGCSDLGPGDQCECEVLNIDAKRGRFGLRFKSRQNVLVSLR